MNRFSSSFPSTISRPLRRSVRRLLTSPLPSDAGDEFGFRRPEFGREKLVGTVQPYDRHVFLCNGSPDRWHPVAESQNGMPRLLLSAINARMGQTSKKTKLTICEGEDSGDVLIFPDMIRYRRVMHSSLDDFVEQVLVKEAEWPDGSAETMRGSYVFVCAHGSRDKRCGVCGPVLVDKFEEEIGLRGLRGQVCVKACSHVGGHKYAGNVIIFRWDMKGVVHGHWYGYVAPDDVPVLLDQHIGNGNIVDRLWRGQMGLSQDDQKKTQNLRLQPNDVASKKQPEPVLSLVNLRKNDLFVR